MHKSLVQLQGYSQGARNPDGWEKISHGVRKLAQTLLTAKKKKEEAKEDDDYLQLSMDVNS